jgi:hypothetical protein
MSERAGCPENDPYCDGVTVTPPAGVDYGQYECPADPTLDKLNAVIASYPDWDDKLNIALGNFNRVRAERDALAVRVETLETALAELIRAAEKQMILPYNAPMLKDARAALAGRSVGPADDTETT